MAFEGGSRSLLGRLGRNAPGPTRTAWQWFGLGSDEVLDQPEKVDLHDNRVKGPHEQQDKSCKRDTQPKPEAQPRRETVSDVTR